MTVYRGRAGVFELVAAPQRAEDYTLDVWPEAVPLLIPGGEGGVCLFLTHVEAKKYAGAFASAQPPNCEALARKLVYAINTAVHDRVRATFGADDTRPVTGDAIDRFNAEVDEARARIADWQRLVLPLIEDAFAVAGAKGE